MDPASAF